MGSGNHQAMGMWARAVAFFAAALLATACAAADLTATETRWLTGAWPVVLYARQAGLPLDIVVQPQPTPGEAPLALAFIDGRCKLVMSMRGNAEAEATLARIDPALLDATLELMAAHELGHCRRYLDGAWYGVPAGFADALPAGLDLTSREAYEAMKAARREEGYGDLVGLAWTQQRHPQRYAALYAWLVAERSQDVIPGSHHDTRAWLRRVAGGFDGQATSIFDAPAAVWAASLGDED